MKILLSIFLAAVSTSAVAAPQCYRMEEEPFWSMRVNDRQDDPEQPEMVWLRDGKEVNLGTAGAGTGISRRYALEADDPSKTYGYVFVDTALVFDWDVYRSQPCK